MDYRYCGNGERKTDQLRLHRIERIGLGIETDKTGLSRAALIQSSRTAASRIVTYFVVSIFAVESGDTRIRKLARRCSIAPLATAALAGFAGAWATASPVLMEVPASRSGPLASAPIPPRSWPALLVLASQSQVVATRRVSVPNSIASGMRPALAHLVARGTARRIKIQRHIGTQLHQLCGNRRAISALAMMFSRRLTCLISPARVQQRIEIAELFQKLAAVFGPIPGIPGTMSDRVTHQR